MELEVASTYTPNHHLLDDDLGAIAARRQGDLAENLFPFKLVSEKDSGRTTSQQQGLSRRYRTTWV